MGADGGRAAGGAHWSPPARGPLLRPDWRCRGGIVIAGADWWARPIAGRLVPALVLHIGTGPSLLSESDAQLMRRTLDHGFAVVLSLARAADVEVLIADLVAANREC